MVGIIVIDKFDFVRESFPTKIARERCEMEWISVPISRRTLVRSFRIIKFREIFIIKLPIVLHGKDFCLKNIPWNHTKIIFEQTICFKIHSADFYISLILREIDFGNSRSAKNAILENLEALNLDFYEFFALFSTKRAYEMAKMAVLELLDSLKVDFT